MVRLLSIVALPSSPYYFFAPNLDHFIEKRVSGDVRVYHAVMVQTHSVFQVPVDSILH